MRVWGGQWSRTYLNPLEHTFHISSIFRIAIEMGLNRDGKWFGINLDNVWIEFDLLLKGFELIPTWIVKSLNGSWNEFEAHLKRTRNEPKSIWRESGMNLKTCGKDNGMSLGRITLDTVSKDRGLHVKRVWRAPVMNLDSVGASRTKGQKSMFSKLKFLIEMRCGAEAGNWCFS